MAISHVESLAGGDLLAINSDGSRTYLTRSIGGLWRPASGDRPDVQPPVIPPTPVATISAEMVEVSVTSAGGSVGNMQRTPQQIADLLNSALARTNTTLTSKAQAANLVAQCAYETAYWRTWVEYPDGSGNWDPRYTPWHGRGMIQLTWAENYLAFGQWVQSIGLTSTPHQFVDNPDLVAQDEWAAIAAIYYFRQHGIGRSDWEYRNLFSWCDSASSPWYAISRAIHYGSPTASYVAGSYDMRGHIVDSVLGVTPNPIDVPPADGSVQARLVDWMHSRHNKFFYTQDLDIRPNPDVTGGTDCSALVRRAYLDICGFEIGTWTGGQQSYGRIVIDVGENVDETKMVIGDLVFFTWYGSDEGYNFSHVEMYTGPNQTCGHGGPGNGPYDKTLSGQVSSSSMVRVRRYV